MSRIDKPIIQKVDSSLPRAEGGGNGDYLMDMGFLVVNMLRN
jgi:hypothetical protein